MCWNKGRLCWKIPKLFYFCHLKKLVRLETFGPYYVYDVIVVIQYIIPWWWRERWIIVFLSVMGAVWYISTNFLEGPASSVLIVKEWREAWTWSQQVKLVPVCQIVWYCITKYFWLTHSCKNLKYRTKTNLVSNTLGMMHLIKDFVTCSCYGSFKSWIITCVSQFCHKV